MRDTETPRKRATRALAALALALTTVLLLSACVGSPAGPSVGPGPDGQNSDLPGPGSGEAPDEGGATPGPAAAADMSDYERYAAARAAVVNGSSYSFDMSLVSTREDGQETSTMTQDGTQQLVRTQGGIEASQGSTVQNNGVAETSLLYYRDGYMYLDDNGKKSKAALLPEEAEERFGANLPTLSEADVIEHSATDNASGGVELMFVVKGSNFGFTDVSAATIDSGYADFLSQLTHEDGTLVATLDQAGNLTKVVLKYRYSYSANGQQLSVSNTFTVGNIRVGSVSAIYFPDDLASYQDFMP